MTKKIILSSLFFSLTSIAGVAAAQSSGDNDCSQTDWGPALQLDSNDLRDGCALDYDSDFHINVVRDPREVTVNHPREDPRTFTKMYIYESDWDGGWGWTDSPAPGDKNNPYCIFAESMSVLERAGANTPSSDRFVLTEALAYVKEHTSHWQPKCKKPNDEDFTTNANSGSPDWLGGIGGSHTRLYQNFFDMDAANRAATLLHEAWHRGTNQRHGGGKVDGLSTDTHYESIYGESQSLFDGGVSPDSLHVAWIQDYISIPNDARDCKKACPSGRATINSFTRKEALNRGNRILQTRFSRPTSKRLNQFTADTVLAAKGSTSLASPWIQYGVTDDDNAPQDEREAVLGALETEPCGLMGINGAFREQGDYVKIVEEEHTSGGVKGTVKVLKSHSEHTRDSRATGGLAACFPTVRYTFGPKWFGIEGENKSLTEVLQSDGGSRQNAGDRTCFITGIEGRLEGNYDSMGVRIGDDDWWEVFIRSNSRDSTNFQRVQIACVNAEFVYQLDNGTRKKIDDEGNEINVSNRRSESVGFDLSLHSSSGFTHQCVLSQVTGRMFNTSDQIWIREQDFTPPFPTFRTLKCDERYSTWGNNCTTWDLFVDGDGSIFDRNQAPVAACFRYEIDQ